MDKTLKIAFVSRIWGKWHHRILAGTLKYIETHPRAQVRTFAPTTGPGATAVEVEAWGADGILAALDETDQMAALGALSRRIPMVNTALTRGSPDVVTVVADFRAYLKTSITHFRHLGLRSFALLLLEDSPVMRDLLGAAFLRYVNPPVPERAVHYCPAVQEKAFLPHADVKPIPASLTRWLHALPKPAGILCPGVGVGTYLIRCCNELGLRVPEDLAVIGGDDMDWSLTSEPTMTSAVPDLESIGEEAVAILTNMIAGRRPPESIIRLSFVTLQVRESTGLRKPEICDIGAALQFIHNNACRGITVGEVIKQTQQVSRVTFHRRFLETVGKSPAEAIRERKLEETRRLLTFTELPLSMVSELAGFSSANELARQFRAAEELSPRAYRMKTKPAISERKSTTDRSRLTPPSRNLAVAVDFSR